MVRRVQVPVDHPVPGGTTNAYLLGEEPVLVDPAGSLDELEIDPESVAHVAATHTHPDHVAGVAALHEATGATVWALASHRDRFRQQTGIEPDRTFGPGDTLGDSGVTCFYLPGHAPDHVAFLFEGAAVLGDLARQDGSVMVGPPDGDMRAYLASLRRLRQLPIDTAYPAHGSPIRDPKARFGELITHRLDRERRVERAVIDGTRDPEAIVAAAYDKDLTGVAEAARRTVEAHLEKLAAEGRIRWDGTVASPG